MFPRTRDLAPGPQARRRLAAGSGIGALLTAMTVGIGVARVDVTQTAGSTDPDRAEGGATSATVLPAVKRNGLRVASLNVLAAEHTSDPRPSRMRTRAQARAGAIQQLLSRNDLDVAGLDDLRSSDLRAFSRVSGRAWGVYPHQATTDLAVSGVAWRTPKLRLVEGEVEGRGEHATPYALLVNPKTGRRVYVVHVPQAARVSADPAVNGSDLMRRLRRTDVPVIRTDAPVPLAKAEPEVTAKPEVNALAGLTDPDASSAMEVTNTRLTRRSAEFTFKVASYNILGANHTGSGGNRKGAGWATRLGWSMSVIRAQDPDVIGFQEFQDPQLARFRSLTGWNVYPANTLSNISGHNSIAWNPSVWETVSTQTIGIPYFGGGNVEMPYVRLRHRASGEEAYFANFHNPANVHGNAQRWRDVAEGREAALATRLHDEGVPVILTGDFNEREEVFCALTTNAPLKSASGGSTGSPCQPPRAPYVDWIFGTTDIDFTEYVAVRDGLARRASDHPMIAARATAKLVEKPLDLRVGQLSVAEAEAAARLEPWAPAQERMRSTVQLLDEQSIGVVGFQELRPAQLSAFRGLTKGVWESYPDQSAGSTTLQSSVAWRTSQWRRVEAGTLAVRRASGRQVRMPFVRLQHATTGRTVQVLNTYNPMIDGLGDLRPDRRALARAVVALARRLERAGVPLIVTGGMGERPGELCKAAGDLSLNLATATGSSGLCEQTEGIVADPIVGAAGVTFTSVAVVHDGLVRKATDQPLVTADADLAQ